MDDRSLDDEREYTERVQRLIRGLYCNCRVPIKIGDSMTGILKRSNNYQEARHLKRPVICRNIRRLIDPIIADALKLAEMDSAIINKNIDQLMEMGILAANLERDMDALVRSFGYKSLEGSYRKLERTIDFRTNIFSRYHIKVHAINAMFVELNTKAKERPDRFKVSVRQVCYSATHATEIPRGCMSDTKFRRLHGSAADPSYNN